jgi:hypothetical protein
LVSGVGVLDTEGSILSASIAFSPHKIPERWRPFLGDNHQSFPLSERPTSSPCRLAGHLGRPLSDALWEDLQRLGCHTLYVSPAAEQPGEPYWFQVYLLLDEACQLVDIWLFGLPPLRKCGIVFRDSSYGTLP